MKLKIEIYQAATVIKVANLVSLLGKVSEQDLSLEQAPRLYLSLGETLVKFYFNHKRNLL